MIHVAHGPQSLAIAVLRSTPLTTKLGEFRKPTCGEAVPRTQRSNAGISERKNSAKGKANDRGLASRGHGDRNNQRGREDRRKKAKAMAMDCVGRFWTEIEGKNRRIYNECVQEASANGASKQNGRRK